MWVHGPFPCGSHSDLRIFRMKMKGALEVEECVIADGGYRDSKCVNTADNPEKSHRFSFIRARHETFNGRLRNFFVLSHRFRHSISRHSFCFHAVANITHLMVSNGDALFSI